MTVSKTQRAVLDDLQTNGPMKLGLLGWPERNGQHAFFGFHRVTARTWDSLEKKGLVEWSVVREDGGLKRVYRAKEDHPNG